MLNAPPRSGKTSLLQLIAYNAQASGQARRCFYFNAAVLNPKEGPSVTFKQAWQKKFKETWEESTTSISPPASARPLMDNPLPAPAANPASKQLLDLYLIDEAHVLYDVNATGSEAVWGFAKSMHSGDLLVCRPGTPELPYFKTHHAPLATRVVIFAAAFGSSRFGPSMLHTPLEFSQELLVGLRY
jgi:hypothetical protein